MEKGLARIPLAGLLDPISSHGEVHDPATNSYRSLTSGRGRGAPRFLHEYPGRFFRFRQQRFPRTGSTRQPGARVRGLHHQLWMTGIEELEISHHRSPFYPSGTSYTLVPLSDPSTRRRKTAYVDAVSGSPQPDPPPPLPVWFSKGGNPPAGTAAGQVLPRSESMRRSGLSCATFSMASSVRGCVMVTFEAVLIRSVFGQRWGGHDTPAQARRPPGRRKANLQCPASRTRRRERSPGPSHVRRQGRSGKYLSKPEAMSSCLNCWGAWGRA